jgi:hypothetical protein
VKVADLTLAEAMASQGVQGGDLAFGCVNSDLALNFGVFSMSGIIARFPFLVAQFPDQADDVAGPVGTVLVAVGAGDVRLVEITVLKADPLLGPSSQQKLIPSDACLAVDEGLEPWGKMAKRDIGALEPVIEPVQEQV